MKLIKKAAVLGAATSTFIATALPAFAQSVDAASKFGLGYASVLGLSTKDLRESLMGVVNVLLGFLGVIAVIIVLWGGFRWMTAGGNEDKVGEAKKIITSGIIGLVIIFISFAIVTFVINQLSANA